MSFPLRCNLIADFHAEQLPAGLWNEVADPTPPARPCRPVQQSVGMPTLHNRRQMGTAEVAEETEREGGFDHG